MVHGPFFLPQTNLVRIPDLEAANINEKLPVQDLHWMTYLGAPYRRYIPDSAVPELRERFGFEEYAGGGFSVQLTTSVEDAYANPEQLELARNRVLELVGPELLREVPEEVLRGGESRDRPGARPMKPKSAD